MDIALEHVKKSGGDPELFFIETKEDDRDIARYGRALFLYKIHDNISIINNEIEEAQNNLLTIKEYTKSTKPITRNDIYNELKYLYGRSLGFKAGKELNMYRKIFKHYPSIETEDKIDDHIKALYHIDKIYGSLY